MIVISNTGPLIALAKLDRLDLLQQLVPDGVFIPPIIQRELWAKTGFESSALDAALEGFIQIRKPENVPFVADLATMYLDEGEKQVVRLAASLSEPLFVLLDDNAGRKAAKKLGLAVTGTAGLLVSAKKQGLIPAVVPMLEMLREQGYWLSDELVVHVRGMVGE
jgi:predicted nucleic acid-binding protein